MADQITYHYSSLQQSVDDIHNIVQNINNEIDDLASQAKTAMANWTMQGSQQYQQDVQKIQTDLDNNDGTLDQLSQAIGESATAFNDLDNKVAQSFQ
jgi:WXG100 family type VII secretion target